MSEIILLAKLEKAKRILREIYEDMEAFKQAKARIERGALTWRRSHYAPWDWEVLNREKVIQRRKIARLKTQLGLTD